MNRYSSITRKACASLLLLAGFAGSALAQSAQPSLDELLDLGPSEPAQTPAEPAKDSNESIKDALSVTEATDAFEQAVVEMDSVARRIGRSFDTGVETQRMQESILRKLEQVIESAEQNSGGGGSSSSSKQDPGAEQLAQQDGQNQGEPSGRGNQASTGQAGVTTPIDPEDQDAAIEQLRKEWGVLPPRVREELSDGLRERFSPLYRRMTEAYYKALAEQE